MSSESKEREETCSDCSGTGKADVYNEEKQEWEEQDCGTCSGTGKVKIIESDEEE